jgi:hypothetical protein
MDYKNGKIYKLVSNETDKMYIGSTCTQLSKRFYKHKDGRNQYNKGKGQYVTSYEILGYEDAEIVLIENYPCHDKNELHARERYWIEQHKMNCVNKNIPTRKTKERYEDNKNMISERCKQYYEKNRQRILDTNKQYREGRKEIINAKKREYRENNKEKIAETKKQWYENNKNSEKFLAKKQQRYQCECGSDILQGEKSCHMKSKKHQTFIMTR